ncbi:peroxiredoxin (plasmid) [Paracoccus sp. TK19116]|uniref:Glutathione-dependent peroxiredoxin n=1 Tax=Paracoccus albicereus TaxID=2922394 RepID=A0ABT1MLG4_9RHOB|nr:peroxiredoxin [Paracoccus albicereus]MCQ0969127.1 peroxiredoxin [Paracoccus albicereus]
MPIEAGDKLPDANLLRVGEKGPEQVSTSEFQSGRVAIFAVPGAFTGTCTNAHMPSFVRTAQAFRDKGVSRIVCVTVNDPFVAKAWSDATGAGDAGIEVLADADGSFTRAMGQNFDAPLAGLHGRSKRYALLASNGTVDVINVEEGPGQCSVSAGESLLEQV